MYCCFYDLGPFFREKVSAKNQQQINQRNELDKRNGKNSQSNVYYV